MSVQSKSFAMLLSLRAFLTAFLLGFASSGDAQSIREAIFKSENETNAPKTEVIELLLQQVLERSRYFSASFSWGANAKIWCEIVLIDTNAISISECARARVGAVSEMSNPQPSRELALAERVSESQGFLHQALKIEANKEQNANRYIIQRIEVDQICLEKFKRNESAIGCYLDYRF